MGRMEESRRLVVEALKDRSVAVEPSESGDLRFEYRSVPMRARFDRTKHGEPDMTIELAERPSPDRMACWAYRIIMPWWQDSWSDDDHTGFRTMIGPTLETLADDAFELQQLTSEAHQDAAEFLDSIRVRYVVDGHGEYGFDWNSVPLTFELYRNPGKTYLAVSTHWGWEGFVTGRTEEHLLVPVERDDLLRRLDSLARLNRTEAEKTRRWFK